MPPWWVERNFPHVYSLWILLRGMQLSYALVFHVPKPDLFQTNVLYGFLNNKLVVWQSLNSLHLVLQYDGNQLNLCQPCYLYIQLCIIPDVFDMHKAQFRPPLFKMGGGGVVNFDYLPQKGGWKTKKDSGCMVQGQVLLTWKGGLTLFLFNFFKVYHF